MRVPCLCFFDLTTNVRHSMSCGLEECLALLVVVVGFGLVSLQSWSASSIANKNDEPWGPHSHGNGTLLAQRPLNEAP